MKDINTNPLPPDVSPVDLMLADGSTLHKCDIQPNPRTVGKRDSYRVTWNGVDMFTLYKDSDHFESEYDTPPITHWRPTP